MTKHAHITTQHAQENSLSAVLRSPRLIQREVLAGVITALALIPEVISFFPDNQWHNDVTTGLPVKRLRFVTNDDSALNEAQESVF